MLVMQRPSPRIFSPLDVIISRFDDEARRIHLVSNQDKVVLRENVAVNMGPLKTITFINAESKLMAILKDRLYKNAFFLGDLRIEKLENVELDVVGINEFPSYDLCISFLMLYHPE